MKYLRFYLLRPLIFFPNKYGFKVIDASRIPNYAGSINMSNRQSTFNKNIKFIKSVKKFLLSRKKFKTYFILEKKYKQYANKVIKVKKDLI